MINRNPEIKVKTVELPAQANYHAQPQQPGQVTFHIDQPFNTPNFPTHFTSPVPEVSIASMLLIGLVAIAVAGQILKKKK